MIHLPESCANDRPPGAMEGRARRACVLALLRNAAAAARTDQPDAALSLLVSATLVEQVLEQWRLFWDGAESCDYDATLQRFREDVNRAISEAADRVGSWHATDTDT